MRIGALSVIFIVFFGWLAFMLLTKVGGECVEQLPFDPDNPPWTRVPGTSRLDNPPQSQTRFIQKYFIL